MCQILLKVNLCQKVSHFCLIISIKLPMTSVSEGASDLQLLLEPEKVK